MSLTYSRAFYDLRTNLQPQYDEREAVALAHEILEFITGYNRIERLSHKETLFTDAQQAQYDSAVTDMLKGCPLQYVTNTAWFMGREYYVNEHVLIPRPETEELVQWILDDQRSSQFPIPNAQILDIGSGSGCIPISLKLALPETDVTACDISPDALTVAKTNANNLQAAITFIQLDFLDTTQHNKLTTYDVIVSNPPYIPMADRQTMHTNVKDHEPDIALFVPDNDALLFYRAIAIFGRQHLKTNGYIYCELDSAHATACKELFEQHGYKNVEIRKDLNDNWRMLRAHNKL